MDEKMIDFSKIPEWWAVCPGYYCPKRDECLRYMAFVQSPKALTRWKCVLPQALDDGECYSYQKVEKVRMAYGFHGLMDKIKGRDAKHDIRIALTDHFGSKGSYYRYKDGERMLSPEEQQKIESIMRRNGFEGDIAFDKYEESYDFTRI